MWGDVNLKEEAEKKEHVLSSKKRKVDWNRVKIVNNS